MCDRFITLDELLTALKSMDQGKTPGNDGLTTEFLLYFFETIGGDLLKCLNACFETDSLTVSQKQAVISLIGKPGKDSCLINSWRPISLLNTDIKVLSKVLSNRIKHLLPKIIHPDQSAFVSNRYIGEPIRQISDLLNYTDENNIPGILFGADFASAFDSIDYNFMFSVFKKFGFGEVYRKWIKILHTDLNSCILNNGYSTGYFKLNRGTRQGDPMVPYIFILIIEILAIIIQKNIQIKCISVNGIEIKSTLFADDATFFWQI